jgi:glycosyltransferase involved in cell wall biosynthesis
MSVRIFHPMVAPFVQQAARALHEAGQLDRYITSIRYAPDSVAQRAAFAAGRLIGLDLEREFRRRTVNAVPAALVDSRPWGELLRVATARADRDGRLTDFVWERTEQAFDSAVARSLHPELTGVYAFEYSSLATITRANALGIRVAYDMPAPEPRFVQAILDREAEKFPELVTPWHRWTAEREDQRIARRHAEFARADVVIAASQFTRRSFGTAGLDMEKVRLVPYGAPPVADRELALRGGTPAGPLELVWAGTFSVRKGAHYLLDAWREHRLGRAARLRVYGSVPLPDRVVKPIPDGIEFAGAVPHSELMAALHRADALIFPTLCDGFGMVVTEAWSRGVPVITTDCAGAADLLRDGENGQLIKAGDAAEIARAVEWCAAHRTELRAMREPALMTAASWQWPDYRARLAATLRSAGLFSA